MAEVLASVLGDPEPKPGRGMGRRAFLKLGAAGLVATAGGSVWWAQRQGVFGAGVGPAYEPWSEFSHLLTGDWTGDPGLAMVRGAILAASPHNSQPWVFRLEPGRLEVIADLSRNLGPVDPFLRELFIAQGCALENLELTARGIGVPLSVTILPDRDDLRLAAVASWDPQGAEPQPSPGPAFQAILDRRTDRGPYDVSRRIPERVLEEWVALAEREEGVTLRWIREAEEKRRFGDLVIEATEATILDGESGDVTSRWLRTDPMEIHQERDGLTLDGQGMGALTSALVKILPGPSRPRIEEGWLDATRDRQVPTTDAFGVLSVEDPDDRGTQIATGRAWQRIHLAATASGVSMHPMNQIPQRAGREQALGLEPRFGEALEGWASGRSGLLCFRAGFGAKPPPPSPRRGASEVLVG